MKISRDFEGLRFIGECAPETGFVAEDVHCIRCGRRIDPLSDGPDIALNCSGCGFRGKVFWSEAELHVYLVEQWNHLRRACSHPTVNALRRPSVT